MDALSAFARSECAARLRRAALRGTLSHALIFLGTGDRLTAARYTAAAMECTSPGEKPCLACAHCRKVMADIHPDVRFVRDEAHKELSADTVREMRADVFIRPNEGARKIYIFEDCTLLNEKDQNLLLKVVEDGPPYAAFFFCAENPAVLLQTIRSRCVSVRLSGDAGAEDAPAVREQAEALCRLAASGTAAERAAFLVGLENAKTTREALAALLDAAQNLLSAALLSLYGRPPDASDAETAQLCISRLTKQQILGTIDLFRRYRRELSYNVGVGVLLGGLAVEWEELL